MKTYGEGLRTPPAGIAVSAGDEFTGDPRIRDIWARSRDKRHALIRAMLGDPWSEKTLPQRITTLFTTSFLWIISIPFIWAALAAVTLFVVSFALVPYDQPIESVMGHGFDGGLGDKIMIGTAIVSVLLATFGAWGRTLGNDREIRRLRGLSNTDLLAYHDAWLARKAREAARDQADIERLQRQQDARYAAEETGRETIRVLKQSGLYKGSIYQ
jgi:hypothetical protein